MISLTDLSFCKRMQNKYSNKIGKQSGQVMIMTVLALGGTILGATTIAGLLMVYQIRQSTDMANSVKAVYAADAGIEWKLYDFFIGSAPTLSFQDSKTSASTTMSCYDSSGSSLDCATTPAVDVARIDVRSIGRNGAVSRAFKISF